ncbi:TAXI family TRAP transporter solute-binding subunit [Rugosibacter aromaticivorans]|uniref:TAXI family TRAP transporter solute-binding subunit n=1 Tax=Rugosibacter aromaticivorans TaxID=1565605 RepID=UPI000AF00BDD|nr:TAXI family TRAP transporter solute-binding subunit [Rugosibacter aromaticivorans]
MPEKLKLLSWRDVVFVAIPSLLLILAAFWVAARYIKPAPPARMVISTGSEGGAYQRFGALYTDVLARYGVELIVKPSAGSPDNLQRLRDRNSGVDAAFIQGGTALSKSDDDGLVSLGELYYEPLWIFYRQGVLKEGARVLNLKGKRLAIGQAGSGTQRLATEMLSANGIDAQNTPLIEAGGFDVVSRLQTGEIDAVFVVGPTQSALVWALLYTPGVHLLDVTQAEAYTRRFAYLKHLVLPRGAIDLVQDIPPRDIQMVSTTATLLAREDMHPALIWLLLQAASEVHGEPGVFQKPAEFPRSEGNGEFPMAQEAVRYYANGKPFLQRYLPFWAAILVDRLLVLLVPILAVLYPLFRFAPGLYGWRVRSRIYRRYGELKFLESEVEEDPQRHTRDEWLRKLDEIEADVSHIRTPLAFADMLYTLRQHAGLARETILKRTAA